MTRIAAARPTEAPISFDTESLRQWLTEARAAAMAAGQIHLEYLKGTAAGLGVETKEDESPVTKADRESEEMLRERLRALTPEFGILGEEYGEEGDQTRRWVLDPLDGTKAFIRGLPNFACLIGLVVDGVTQVGVVHAAMLGQTWYAARGLGAWREDHYSWASAASEPVPLRVSETATLAEAAGAVSNPHTIAQSDTRWAALQEALRPLQYCRGYGDWWGHCLVAQGSLDLNIDPRCEIYDISPLQVIVEEAGGTFTGLNGAPGLEHGHSLSTNGKLHRAVYERVAAAYPSRLDG